jgi:3-oxoadipate enol-lactonase
MTPIPHFATLGSGPTVLMLHGIGGGHDAFAPQLEALAQAGYRAVSWDAPGYGSSAPVEPYTFKALAHSAVALIEALIGKTGEASITLVGHSMGGMVAQEVAARRPELLRGLVLAGTSAAFGKTDGAWQKQFIAERTAPLEAGGSMATLAAQLVPRMIGPGADPHGARLGEAVMGRVPEATYRRALECLLTFDRRDHLSRISVPTLLIAGEFDRNAPASVMQGMQSRIPNCSWALMKNMGHIMQLEAPDEFSRLLVHFLREILEI